MSQSLLNGLAQQFGGGTIGQLSSLLGPLLSGGYPSRALGSDGSRILGHLLG